jgi:hypothetical protein
MLTQLQVELYSHLVYHLRELRQPLKTLIDNAYERLPDIGQEEEEVIKKDLDNFLEQLEPDQ